MPGGACLSRTVSSRVFRPPLAYHDWTKGYVSRVKSFAHGDCNGRDFQKPKEATIITRVGTFHSRHWRGIPSGTADVCCVRRLLFVRVRVRPGGQLALYITDAVTRRQIVRDSQ